MASRATSAPATFAAASVSRAHTCVGLFAFLSALTIGCLLHYEKIVKNDVAGYPDEWFPSVSATIGDWYPERNLFQVLVALAAGPRFGLTILQYQLHSLQSPQAYLPAFVFWSGIVRTFMCGFFVFVPSYESHLFHDVAMVGYIVCDLPWMIGGWACSSSHRTRRLRRFVGLSFFAAIVPLVYFFIQHKVHRIPGAYTHYAFFEWSLIILDVLYDGITEVEFREANLQVAIGTSLRHGLSSSTTPETDEIATQDANAAKASEPKSNTKTAEPSAAPTVKGAQNTPGLRGLTTAILSSLLKPTERHPALSFASDVYLSYIYWTLLTSLAPSFFYYSVWQLGVAGQEITLLTTLSPILLAIPPIKSWTESRGGKITLWAGGLVGIASYVTRFPSVRMLCIGVANACLSMVKASDWSNPGNAAYEGLIVGLGLILSSLSKHANHSNNPAWPILNELSGGYNKTALVLATAAVYELATRKLGVDPLPEAAANNAVAKDDTSTSKSAIVEEPTAKSAVVERKPPLMSWLPASLAFGGLMFSLHKFLADSSTIVTWTWTGFPVSGPVPNLHGSITLVAQAGGVLFSLALWAQSIPIPGATVSANSATSEKSNNAPVPSISLIAFIRSPTWYIFGITSAYVLYAFPDWTGYAGGLGLTIVLMSIIPVAMHQVSQAANVRGPATVFMTAWLVVSVLDFVDVMTVAYAFIPGGQIFRERTDIVLAIQLLLLTPVFRWPRISVSDVHVTPISPRLASYTRSFLVCSSILAAAATIYRLPADAPKPHRPGPRIVRAGIWTVHFGIDDEGRDSQRRMRHLIQDMELDIVGLLETDLHRIPYGNRDLTRVISEELGFFVDVGPGPNKHTWGAVLLSKYPIINTTHHLLPSPHGELAPAIEAVLDIYGTAVTVVVAHNGQEEDALDRELQSKELARIMVAAQPRPVIFLGYVVTKPHAERPAPYEIMVTDGNMHDVDGFDQDRWCEYILYRGLYRTSYARISRSTITDTELQIGQFIVPEYGKVVEDDSHEARYMRSFKEALPEEHWFPMAYYGNDQQGGVRGHFYHVFNTPLYYKWPGMPERQV